MKLVHGTLGLKGKVYRIVVSLYDLKKDQEKIPLSKIPRPWEKMPYTYYGITEERRFLIDNIQIMVNNKEYLVISCKEKCIFVSDFRFKRTLENNTGNALFVEHNGALMIRLTLSEGCEELNWSIDEKKKVTFFPIVRFP